MTQLEEKAKLLVLYNILGEFVSDSKLGKNMFVEDYFDPFCEDKVLLIMDAMKKKHKIRFEIIDLSEVPSVCYHVVTFAAYQLGYINERWYMIGQSDERGLMRIPLSFYWQDAIITDDSYEYPTDYSPEEYNKLFYGTTSERLYLVIEIRERLFNHYNFSKYPLMPFQQKVENGYWDKEGKRLTYLKNDKVRVHLDIPKTPFALYALKNKLKKYDYKIISVKDPFALFNDSQYYCAINEVAEL